MKSWAKALGNGLGVQRGQFDGFQGLDRRGVAQVQVPAQGLNNNGTANGDSSLKTAGLPPLAPFGCRG
jgi:hypothetical protein